MFFGVADSLKALDAGAVDTLIVWENLDITMYTFKNPNTNVQKVVYLNKEQEKDAKHFHDPDTQIELEIVDKQPLIEWFAENYKKFGAKLEFITNRSQEGSQFCKGFGGIGGILRYKLELDEDAFNAVDDDDDDDLMD